MMYQSGLSTVVALTAFHFLNFVSAQNSTIDSVTSSSSIGTSTTLVTSADAATTEQPTESEPAYIAWTDPSSPSETAPSAPTTPSDPKTHLIKVGAGGHTVEPQQLTNAAIGDILTFEFYPGNHSIARAEYKKACVPIEYTDKNKKGFWSGPQPVGDSHDVRITISFLVQYRSMES
jgi:hypothetical protein